MGVGCINSGGRGGGGGGGRRAGLVERMVLCWRD